jgi:phosphatidylinositol-4,5-bisphosphate 3-kinase
VNSGRFQKKMWTDHDLDLFLSTCESNEDDPIVLCFTVPAFHFPVAYVPGSPGAAAPKEPPEMTVQEMRRLAAIQKTDPLSAISEEDRGMLWRYRGKLTNRIALLPWILQSCPLSDPAEVAQVPVMLARWDFVPPTDALTLLDAQFALPEIRAYAVGALEKFEDHEIMLYMLQLVHALKYELYDDSPLVRFLVKRGLLEPKFLGHQLSGSS